MITALIVGQASASNEIQTGHVQPAPPASHQPAPAVLMSVKGPVGWLPLASMASKFAGLKKRLQTSKPAWARAVSIEPAMTMRATTSAAVVTVEASGLDDDDMPAMVSRAGRCR